MNNIFAEYIKSDGITFRHAKGASIESGKEIHTFHEIILFLEGNAQLITERLNTKLNPNTLIVIPKETYHQVVIHGDKNHYHRCVLNFDDTLELRNIIKSSVNNLAIINADSDIVYLFDKLRQNTEGKNATIILRSVLALLLCEISKKSKNDLPNNSQNPLVIETIKYINENISAKIKTDDIAKHCNISASSLSHLFKKEMNIPLHKFIIKKRLIAAYHKISQGDAATVAAMECGFNDYSGFYKQYIKMFGFAPSKMQ